VAAGAGIQCPKPGESRKGSAGMNELDLAWLVPVSIQVLGSAIALAVLGFAYENGLRDKNPFLHSLGRPARLAWLAVAAGIFAIGFGLTHAPWEAKACAIFLVIALLGLVIVSRGASGDYPKSVRRAKLTARSVVLLAAQLWLGVFVILAMAWALHLGWHIYHLAKSARSLVNSMAPLQVETILPLVAPAAADVQAIDEQIRPLFPLFNTLQGLPWVGPYLGQVDPLLTYADGLARAGDEIVSGLAPLLEPGANENNNLSLLERASQVLQAGDSQFLAAQAALEQARAARDRIDPGLLPDRVKPYFERLDKRFDLLVAGTQFLQLAPALLGNEQAQTYLILAQNRDELRPTGGFISGIGLLILQDGQIQQFTLGDSYAVDDFSQPYPTPPEALHRFMLADYWLPRDANWSPDFPTAAQEAQALYTLSTGLETQGVIAFNQLAVQAVLQVIGPVAVPGTDEPVTAENVENYMRQAWAPAPGQGISQEWWLHRKDFMQQLGSVILDKVLNSGKQGELVHLAGVLTSLLDQGQLLIYFNDQAAQTALGNSGWEGAIHPGKGDYLYLVDSNVGFNKVDSMVQRSLSYRVDLTDIEHPRSTVTLSYQNNAGGNLPCQQVASYGSGTYQDLQQRCYWDYWRVFAPAGSALQSSTAQTVAASQLLNGQGWSGQVESLAGEGGTQAFAGLLVLPTGQSTQFDLTYTLPSTILRVSANGQLEYSLLVQVQPGLSGLPSTLEIVLPNSLQLISANEHQVSTGAHTWTWQGSLDRSMQIELLFLRLP
jgi:hypothetical protein